MVQKGSPKRGDVKNREQLRDNSVNKVASGETIPNGTLVYQDGANGVKIVPIAGQPDANRIRFAPVGFQGTTSSLGEKEIETVKANAIVVGQADAAITVGQKVKAGAVTAGRFGPDGTPSISTTLGVYLGHVGEVEGTDNEPTDAVNGDLILIQMNASGG